MSAAASVIKKVGSTSIEGDSTFIAEFNNSCRILGLDPSSGALASLAYSLYLSGIIIAQKAMQDSAKSEYAGLLARLDTAKLPQS